MPIASPPRILLVEDNFLAAEEMAQFVRRRGYTVGGAARSVSQSLNLVARQAFEGAIIDVNLSGEPSFPVCRALKAKNVPFLFLTGYASMAVPAEFDAAPYLLKPVVESQLASALDRLVQPPRAVGTFGNAILDALPCGCHETFIDQLARAGLHTGEVLDLPGRPVTHVHFPVDSLLSLFVGGPSRHRIEALSIGREGMTAPHLLLGEPDAAGETVVQFGGRAWRIAADTLLELAAEDASLRRRLLGHVARAMRQITDNTWYTGHATVVERLARWLVQATEKLGSDSVAITHQDLADILGVRRAGITVALHELEGERLIRSLRGTIVVRDRAGLASQALKV
jgi:CheY-like chemotaxis protein